MSRYPPWCSKTAVLKPSSVVPARTPSGYNMSRYHSTAETGIFDAPLTSTPPAITVVGTRNVRAVDKEWALCVQHGRWTPISQVDVSKGSTLTQVASKDVNLVTATFRVWYWTRSWRSCWYRFLGGLCCDLRVLKRRAALRRLNMLIPIRRISKHLGVLACAPHPAPRDRNFLILWSRSILTVGYPGSPLRLRVLITAAKESSQSRPNSLVGISYCEAGSSRLSAGPRRSWQGSQTRLPLIPLPDYSSCTTIQ